MLIFTQGDEVTLLLMAKTGNGVPFDLTGAIFSTTMRGPGNTFVVFPNIQHTADPDQVVNRGKFTLALSELDSASIGTGDGKEIITKVTQGSASIYFHGPNQLRVLAQLPVR